jgi:hypothetical protein
VALPPGYREGLLTAITVFIAFSLAFLKYWSLETPGRWTWLGVLSLAPLVVGLGLQLVALFRSLDLGDDEETHYRRTVGCFRWGVVAVLAGVVISILLEAA